MNAADSKLSHWVYVLECADGTLYVGCTNNLERRVLQHNFSKKGARYTKNRRPVKLVYSEQVESLAAGRKREAEIKRFSRAQKLALVKTTLISH
jgi:putative endonuclease